MADSTFYQAPAVQANPLQMAMQAQQFKNSQLSNQINQFDLDSKKGLADAYAGATDPKTGQVDFNKLQAAVAGNPAAASKMSELLGTTLQQKTGEIANQSSTQDLIAKQRAQSASVLTRIASNPNASLNDLISGGLDLVENGHVPASVVKQALAGAPPAGSPPEAFQKYAATLAAQNAGPSAQQAQNTPNLTPISTGGDTKLVNTSSTAGTPGAVYGAPITNSMTPGDAASPVQVINSAGQPGIQPKAAFAAGAEAPQGGNGRYPQQPAQGGNPRGFQPTALPPGGEALAKAGADRVAALNQGAASAKNQMHTYDLALDATNKALTGPGGAKALTPQAVLETFGLGSQATGDRVKDTQALNSYLASAADQAAASLGLAGSDARLAAAKAGQPNGEMNAPALVQQIKYVKGLQQGVLDKQQAVNSFLAQNGGNTAQLGDFETKFNQAYNPDVSYLRSLPAPEAAAEAKRLASQGKGAELIKGYQALKGMGVH